MIEVKIRPQFDEWRDRARALLEDEREPAVIAWNTGEPGNEEGLFAAIPETPIPHYKSSPKYSVSAEFIEKSKKVSAHRDENRWALLYKILWRITHGEAELLQMSIDEDVARFESMYRSVRRDMHKMTAFVRFKEIRDPADDTKKIFVAWYEPDHLIAELSAPFFARRFNGMRWSILTPDACVNWDGHQLQFAPGCPKSMAPKSDKMESLWKTYYSAIFNPARIKTRAMRTEMPVRYWKNLPETQLIGNLIRQAPLRLQTFHANKPQSATQWLPPALSSQSEQLSKSEQFKELKKSALVCKACGICKSATQTVFGEGPVDARIVLVGEQPGDQEDQVGRPFVGPAGQLLNRALLEAGLVRSELYLTNAVKHFKWKPQGKRRLHQRPTGSEISACKPWLNAELELVRPEFLVCLGATAAQSILGKAIKIGEARGQTFTSGACQSTWVTLHPSSILRAQDPDTQELEYQKLVEDLKRVKVAAHLKPINASKIFSGSAS